MSSNARTTRRSTRRSAATSNSKPSGMDALKPEQVNEEVAAPSPPVVERRVRRPKVKDFPPPIDNSNANQGAEEGSTASSSNPIEDSLNPKPTNEEAAAPSSPVAQRRVRRPKVKDFPPPIDNSNTKRKAFSVSEGSAASSNDPIEDSLKPEQVNEEEAAPSSPVVQRRVRRPKVKDFPPPIDNSNAKQSALSVADESAASSNDPIEDSPKSQQVNEELAAPSPAAPERRVRRPKVKDFPPPLDNSNTKRNAFSVSEGSAASSSNPVEDSLNPKPANEEVAAPSSPVHERRVRRPKVKDFPPSIDNSNSKRSAFSVSEASTASRSNTTEEPPVKRRRMRRTVVKPVVKRADTDEESGDGKRRRKRKVLDWTPDGPTVGEEVPSHDEDDGGDDDPDFDELRSVERTEQPETTKFSSNESYDKESVNTTTPRAVKQDTPDSRPSTPAVSERQARPRRAVNALPSRKQQASFADLPMAEAQFDPDSDSEEYEEDSSTLQNDGLIHVKFDKKTRTVDNYGCYSKYDTVPTRKGGKECKAPQLATKKWMSKYAMVPGQTVLAKLL